MPYRLTYDFQVSWIGPGGQPKSHSGGAQTLRLFGSPTTPGMGGTSAGLGALGAGPMSGAFTAADITALVAFMTSDVTIQLTSNQPRIQGFATGGD